MKRLTENMEDLIGRLSGMAGGGGGGVPWVRTDGGYMYSTYSILGGEEVMREVECWG